MLLHSPGKGVMVMTQDGISVAADAASSLAIAAGARLPAQAGEAASPPAGEAADKAAQPVAVDRITLLSKALEIRQEARKEEAEREESRRQKPLREMNNILFAYNFRGDLRIRFMDSVNTLVYQMPPVLVARISELMTRPDSSVNTKA